MIKWLRGLFTKPGCTKCNACKKPSKEELHQLRKAHMENIVGEYRTYIWFSEYGSISNTTWESLKNRKRLHG